MSQRKQVDPRIPTLIRNNVALNHRSFFVLIGDKGRDQVVNLHFLLAQSRVDARPSVCWCYKKDLGFTTHAKKRKDKIQRDLKRGIRDKDDGLTPFELFVGVTDIRYTYYKETNKVLGRTFGMLVLQDFEAITPNVLARTIETVEGGGIVVLLLRSMTSLRQLYSLSMDVHSRLRSASSPDDPVARFNERFLLSLGASPSCLILDDELNVLPLSRGKDIRPLDTVGDGETKGGLTGKGKRRNKIELELAKLKSDVAGTKVVADVVKHAKTLDQARAVLTILDVLSSTSLSTTVTLTAGRGRGKSAALGLSIAAAVAHGYSNIFVTSPSPENLRTLFEFVFKGLEALGYEERADWDLQRGTGEWKDVVVRVNIFRGHRQTIQYIQPEDAHVLGQAELLVVDEAAAIPLPLVKSLLGPYLVLLSSTVNGYEGTGRSLSLKLFEQLRQSASGAGVSKEQEEALLTSSSSSKKNGKDTLSTGRGSALSTRSLKEIELKEPIRYSAHDDVESWLHQLLCLDASLTPLDSLGGRKKGAIPHPSACELYQVNRDALFSFHPASEVFLQRMMALYVASHYKNSPNDLQLMSDAPGHRLFVLLAPQKAADAAGGGAALPEPLAVLQVTLEGNIARQSILNSLARGTRESGDLVPWLVAQQFQDADFAALSGARVVRLAVHPAYAGMGYGSRALESLRAFYAGELLDVDALRTDADEDAQTFVAARDAPTQGLHDETIGVRDAARMPALLQRLSERRPEALDWLGVSYGLTPALFRFWKKAGYTPLYLSQKASDVTGEFSAVQLRTVRGGATEGPAGWLAEFAGDFRKRFVELLGFGFRELTAVSALTILEACAAGVAAHTDGGAEGGEAGHAIITAGELEGLLGPFDMKRLEAFGNNMVDHHVVLDLLPTLASLYFRGRLPSVEEGAAAQEVDADGEVTLLRLGGLQSALLLSMGLQRRPASSIAAELQLPVAQALALFVKAVRRLTSSVRSVQKRQIAREYEAQHASRVKAFEGRAEGAARLEGVDAELREAGAEDAARRAEEEKRADDAALAGTGLARYALGDGMDWSAAESKVQKDAQDGKLGAGANTVVSVRRVGGEVEEGEKKKRKSEGGRKSSGAGKKARR